MATTVLDDIKYNLYVASLHYCEGDEHAGNGEPTLVFYMARCVWAPAHLDRSDSEDARLCPCTLLLTSSPL